VSEEEQAKVRYPEGTPGREWLEKRLDDAERRLMQLTALNAPAEIVANERRLIEQRKGWLKAWDEDHPKPVVRRREPKAGQRRAKPKRKGQ
jgi:hypothetical protein